MASAAPQNSKGAASKPSPTANTRPNRLPAPTLFVGPPSRNASQLSVSRQLAETNTKPSRDPLVRHKSALARPFESEANTSDTKAAKEISTLPLRKPSDKSIDAKWREMQSTLNEVELTAQSSTHVFGEKHAAALDELRRAQVELARAWGRGNEDKSDATSPSEAQGSSIASFQPPASPSGKGNIGPRKRADTETSASTQLSDESVRTEATIKSNHSHMEDDTAEDIRLANERRAANEAYFKKVDDSVKAVVSKLEAVAEAMRGVEGESRSLWSGTSTTSQSDTRQSDSPVAHAAAAG